MISDIVQEPVLGRRLMAYVAAKVRELGEAARRTENCGMTAVEVGGDAHRVRLRGRRPAELEKGHKSKASESGAVTKDHGGKRSVHREKKKRDSAGAKRKRGDQGPNDRREEGEHLLGAGEGNLTPRWAWASTRPDPPAARGRASKYSNGSQRKVAAWQVRVMYEAL